MLQHRCPCRLPSMPAVNSRSLSNTRCMGLPSSLSSAHSASSVTGAAARGWGNAYSRSKLACTRVHSASEYSSVPGNTQHRLGGLQSVLAQDPHRVLRAQTHALSPALVTRVRISVYAHVCAYDVSVCINTRVGEGSPAKCVPRISGASSGSRTGVMSPNHTVSSSLHLITLTWHA